MFNLFKQKPQEPISETWPDEFFDAAEDALLMVERDRAIHKRLCRIEEHILALETIIKGIREDK